ncbi:histidine kinase [Mitsuaria sp. WAJ17]|uniref:sensor histidine kinase n=1 Tax=Mitsuaria sp. WAJ17 TaxID=2761452 RepID=UPI001602ACCE|nr:histidine kinase [Mitsuaria sp. WAJ17]MBB2487095.1 histidine kinase [Mitsuaria sp. WAJ17]
MNAHPSPTWYEHWQRFARASVRGFHVYASWLVSISWRRFILLSILLIIGANILSNMPPFTWRITEQYEGAPPVKSSPRSKHTPKPPTPKVMQKDEESLEESARKIAEKLSKGEDGVHLDVAIDKHGIRIEQRPKPAAGASAPASADKAVEEGVHINLPNLVVRVPVDKADKAVKSSKPAKVEVSEDELRSQLEEALKQSHESARQQLEEARAAREEAEDARRRVQEELDKAQSELEKIQEEASAGWHSRVRVIHWGEFLIDFSVLFVLASALVKATYKGRIQAEVKAAQATETAEAESLKRQVVEARMAAMQAQVEPHFLFNTLASIDHLIETDPPRASQMQRNLIALLRASMPTMREANAAGVRDLGRELAVIRPYLEILKVRMEDRLQTEIDVPEGLLSAEFPPMMIQSLVENAIKHGLEPKAEGGSLKVRAEVLHGKLAITVADTGLGFGRAATAGTGVGLANIRERLSLLYGGRASVTIAANQPSGTVVTITVPYRSRTDEQGASA